MMRATIARFVKLSVILSLAFSATACTGPITNAPFEQALNAPGMIKVAPYNRSIFSTHNF